MKRSCILVIIVMFFFVTMVFCACNKTPKASMVQATRRFAQYTELQNKANNSGYVDLSEGPKLNYDANLGPKKLNFDFKIVDPY